MFHQEVIGWAAMLPEVAAPSPMGASRQTLRSRAPTRTKDDIAVEAQLIVNIRSIPD